MLTAAATDNEDFHREDTGSPPFDVARGGLEPVEGPELKARRWAALKRGE
jgi:hypothetical protein